MKSADLGARAPNPRLRFPSTHAVRKENAKWAPSRWSEVKASRYRANALAYAANDLRIVLGQHEGALATALLCYTLDNVRSRLELQARGIKTLGDVGD